jgi:hypothetical protein
VAVACRRREIKKEKKKKKKGLRDIITFWRLNKLARYKHGIIIHTPGICCCWTVDWLFRNEVERVELRID